MEEFIENNYANQYFYYFASLFLYDWFLIELGKYLVSINDRDLITILCLNRTIKSKATPIFRKNFLNFQLQKEIFTLLKSSKKFFEIQQIFEQHSLSLNPNVTFTYPNAAEIPKW